MSAPIRSRRIEVRVSDEERRLKEAAAAALGLSLSDFIRQAASSRAHEVLQERTLIAVGDDEAQRFIAALDAEASPPPAMAELFSTEPLWET